MTKTSTKASRSKAAAPTTPNKETRKALPHDLVLSSAIQSAIGVLSWSKFAGDANLGELVKGLRDKVEKIPNGDLRPVEAMLYGQAITLETIFTSLARRATNQEHLNQFQAHLTLALKAQAQCRATLEALGEIKNPRSIAFVKQANIANQQQVNNGSPNQYAHASKSPDAQNELLEASHGNGMDAGAKGSSGATHRKLETVAAGHGSAHARGKSERLKKRLEGRPPVAAARVVAPGERGDPVGARDGCRDGPLNRITAQCASL